MSAIAPTATATPPASTAPKPPWEDRWQKPQLKNPKPVLAARGQSSVGFGEQLVANSTIKLGPDGNLAGAFGAASAPGSLTAVLWAGEGKGFAVAQVEKGFVGATGNPDVDWYEASNIQPDLEDLPGLMDGLFGIGRMNFATNVQGVVQGNAAFLPVLQKGAVGAGKQLDLVKGMTYLGDNLYAGGGVTAASAKQALESAKLLSQQAGHAFVITEQEQTERGTANFLISPLSQLQQQVVHSRNPDEVKFSLKGLDLKPGFNPLNAVDESVYAIINGSVTAVAPGRHAAVDPVEV